MNVARKEAGLKAAILKRQLQAQGQVTCLSSQDLGFLPGDMWLARWRAYVPMAAWGWSGQGKFLTLVRLIGSQHLVNE